MGVLPGDNAMRWRWRWRSRRAPCISFTLLLFFALISTITILRLPYRWLVEGEDGGKRVRVAPRRGIHVVVGRYTGDDLPRASVDVNLTQELLNYNGYDPVAGAGQSGQPVLIRSHEEARMRQLFKINEFNLLASDKIPLNRSLPDVRKKSCVTKKYDVESLHDTSVVIVFHNEAWSTLLRTVQSVIDRSPRRLLADILLVDDASTRSFLGRELDEYVQKLPVKTRVIRIRERSGLIKARLRGASLAEGKVITFLDAHCEVTTGWLEPLLARITEDRRSVVCPVIDIVHDETFAYVRSFELHWGAFNWELHFRWFGIGEEEIRRRRKDMTRPFRTPVMAGGLFAIERDYFYEIGAYDSQMDIWGGENIELSLRVWQCGGQVEIAPCSHVGHIFRKSSPYTFPREGGVGAVLYSNLARAALVWMDEWKEFFFKINPEAGKLQWKLDVSERVALRAKLKCKSFGWYLDNIWPEHFFPTKRRFFGKMRSMSRDACVQRPGTVGGGQPTGPPSFSPCVVELYPLQLFVVSEGGYIMSDESICLDSPDSTFDDPQVRFLACAQLERQQWDVDFQKGKVVHRESKKCLEATSDGRMTLKPCSSSAGQRWAFESQDWL